MLPGVIAAGERGIQHVPWEKSLARGGGQINGCPCRVEADIVNGTYLNIFLLLVGIWCIYRFYEGASIY